MKKESKVSANNSKMENKGNNKSKKEQKFLFRENFEIAKRNSGYKTNIELANDIYIKDTQITKWTSRTNQYPISESNLLLLARQLNVSKDFLLGKTKDDRPTLEKIHYQIAEQNINKNKFFEYLGFKKITYRERNGKFYCMFINDKSNEWKYCDDDYIRFLEDQIINFGYNLLNNYFNSDMVNEFDKEASKEIEADKIKLHRELWGYDIFNSSHAPMKKDSKEFKENFDIIKENPEFEFEDMKEDENGKTLVKLKGNEIYIPIEEAPSSIMTKAKKKKPSEEEIVNQKRFKRLSEKYIQEENNKDSKKE